MRRVTLSHLLERNQFLSRYSLKYSASLSGKLSKPWPENYSQAARHYHGAEETQVWISQRLAPRCRPWPHRQEGLDPFTTRTRKRSQDLVIVKDQAVWRLVRRRKDLPLYRLLMIDSFTVNALQMDLIVKCRSAIALVVITMRTIFILGRGQLSQRWNETQTLFVRKYLLLRKKVVILQRNTTKDATARNQIAWRSIVPSLSYACCLLSSLGLTSHHIASSSDTVNASKEALFVQKSVDALIVETFLAQHFDMRQSNGSTW
jgi:hypothetical protein